MARAFLASKRWNSWPARLSAHCRTAQLRLFQKSPHLHQMLQVLRNNFMTPFTSTINLITGIGTILMQLFAVVLLGYLVFCRKKPSTFLDFVTKRAYVIGFLVGIASMILSLTYSEIIGFAPCMLCWYQRIFMYPLAFIFGIALVKREKHITDYALVLTIVGTLVALYHNALSWFPGVTPPCSAAGPSCTILYTNTFGFITIPLMSLTGFVTVLLVLIARKTWKDRISTNENTFSTSQ